MSAIAKVAGISKKRGRLLMKLMDYLSIKKVLEIGTSVGLGTAALHIGSPTTSIVTIEGCKNTADIARQSFDTFSFKNIDIVVSKFDKALKNVLNKNTFDLIFFDGNHEFQATLDYFEQCLPFAHNDTVFIFDDIHWSQGMENAWNVIIEKPEITVSIDTYQWGIVFFRKEQKKQHFVIRV